jgi:probable rRNA maturation factor
MIQVDCTQEIGKKIPQKFWSTWLDKLTRALKLRGTHTLSIAVVNGPTIRKLNRIYRGKDYITDVLSFRDADGEAPAPGYLGELIICYPQAVRQAREQGHSVERELSILLIHGCLHLLGYEHHERREADKMKQVEEQILGEY